MNNQTIGSLLKIYRKEKTLTQKQLGERINKSEITIRKYENGAKIPKSVFLELCSVFNIAPITWISNVYDSNQREEYTNLFLNDEYTLNHSPDEIYLSKKLNNDELSISSLVTTLIEAFSNTYEVPWDKETFETVKDGVEWESLIDSIYSNIELFMKGIEERNYNLRRLVRIIDKNMELFELNEEDLDALEDSKWLLMKEENSNGN
ncbi:helix-turn-helix transcriptional regulator [Clostridium sp.]|uniref:helix-turn-helix transcriptional regulator n=1 Tax=Clostridium sp. TaxID=1506 RepID=UPI00399246AE